MRALNETHAPSLSSWVTSAEGHPDFPIQNLPFAVFRRRGTQEFWRGGVAIGDQVIDLRKAADTCGINGLAGDALAAAAQAPLNAFMALGQEAWSALRLAVSRALRECAPDRTRWEACLVPLADAEFELPAQVGDYTDFYTSIHHATSVGRLFRPDNPLLPNYRWVPIGYHGRSSSLGVSGQSFPRPRGQLRSGDSDPVLAPSRRLDYELELGIFIGPGNAPGKPIRIGQAEEHVFGFCLLNDWSARDIQSWEYQPLGPFLAKNFATTLSPWIVTLEALAPFRRPWVRDPGEPLPLPYLQSSENDATGAFDIALEVSLRTARMRSEAEPPCRLSTTNFHHAYWTVAQLVTHHTVNGCNLRAGDLLGTGTQSGPRDDEAGSLLELTRGGRQSLTLTNGESRTFLEDGDEVIFRGWCEREGAARIGFGSVTGVVEPVVSEPKV